MRACAMPVCAMPVCAMPACEMSGPRLHSPVHGASSVCINLHEQLRDLLPAQVAPEVRTQLFTELVNVQLAAAILICRLCDKGCAQYMAMARWGLRKSCCAACGEALVISCMVAADFA